MKIIDKFKALFSKNKNDNLTTNEKFDDLKKTNYRPSCINPSLETEILNSEIQNAETTLLSNESSGEAETTLLSNNDFSESETTLLSSSSNEERKEPLLSNNNHQNHRFKAFLLNPINGDKIAINKNVYSIGCSNNMDLQIERMGVSHFHAQILNEGNDIFIIDNNSTNGTKIDGISIEPMKKYRLYDMCIISFADEIYQLLIEGAKR